MSIKYNIPCRILALNAVQLGLKWFYAAHEVLKLILCIGASFQVLLGTLAIPKYAKVLLCSVCFFTVLLDRFATASSPNWLGQYFCAFPAACSILTLKLVVKAMKTWPIQDGRRLTEHSKNYDSAGDWLWSQSQHLISLFLCFFGSRGRGFLSIDPLNLPLSGHQLLQNTRAFGLGPHWATKPLGWSWAYLDRCLRNHPKTRMSTYACLAGRI